MQTETIIRIFNFQFKKTLIVIARLDRAIQKKIKRKEFIYWDNKEWILGSSPRMTALWLVDNLAKLK